MSDIKLYNDDCLQVMPTLTENSIDLILCDLPYNTTACEWDKGLPIDKLWRQYNRLIKINRAIVLFSQQPFTSLLITSNLNQWKYNWIWEKDGASNFLNSHYQPMKVTEDVCVFGTGATSYSPKQNMVYNPQFSEGIPYKITSGMQKSDSAVVRGVEGRIKASGFTTINYGVRYPKNIIKFNRDKEKFHPTQKPIALLQYLIKTYTNEGDVVLDNCMGSGSTGVACKNLNRNFIGIEKQKKYFDIAKERINNQLSKNSLWQDNYGKTCE